tara:strand:+ start:38 stop:748 length:711 start_codon:yes stop_codon:yes gene_type:complete
MSNSSWQNSLSFLEDDRVVQREFRPTGELIHSTENEVPLDKNGLASGLVIRDPYVLAEHIAPSPLNQAGRRVELRFSVQYNGYYPIELTSFTFEELSQAELFGSSKKQAKDCAQWAKYNNHNWGPQDPNEVFILRPGLTVCGYNEDFSVLERVKLVREQDLHLGWFPPINGESYRPRILPGQKFNYSIGISPPSNEEYQILSADSFHLRFDFNFDELNERRQLQLNEDDFGICIPE